jgi:hypothetical protein
MSETPHQRAEAALTAYGLTFPGTTTAPAWAFTRGLYVNGKMFAVFGDKAQPLDALTITLKLPISAEMVADLPFVRQAKGWYKQHNWVIADFGPDDDILADIDMLKAWLRQSYVAIAPKKFSKQLGETS